MKKLSKNDVKDMLRADYTLLYNPMPDEIKNLFPVVTLSIASEYFGIHFTEKHTGKMNGLVSWSTTCKCNGLCVSKINAAIRKIVPEFVGIEKASRKEKQAAKKALRDYINNNPFDTSICICGFCFSDAQQDYQTSMVNPLARNFEILNNGIIHSDWLPVINSLYFRGESFGDFASVNAVKNFVNLMIKNPLVTFAVWTKNTLYFVLAFREVEKPRNMILVKSSAYINRVTRLTKEQEKIVDVVFTVYTAAFAKANNITITCGALACLSCLKCYTRHNGLVYINEILK